MCLRVATVHRVRASVVTPWQLHSGQRSYMVTPPLMHVSNTCPTQVTGHPECPERVPAIEQALRKHGLDGSEPASSDIDPTWVRLLVGQVYSLAQCAGTPSGEPQRGSVHFHVEWSCFVRLLPL